MTDHVDEKKTSWLLEVEADPDNPEDLVLAFPDDLLANAGWKPGDTIVWTDQGDGTWMLTKK